MESLLESGLLIGLIIGLIIVEASVLVGRYRSTGKGAPPSRVISHLVAGALLMAAVQLALWNTAPELILGLLSLAGVSHFSEFRGYWRGD